MLVAARRLANATGRANMFVRRLSDSQNSSQKPLGEKIGDFYGKHLADQLAVEPKHQSSTLILGATLMGASFGVGSAVRTSESSREAAVWGTLWGAAGAFRGLFFGSYWTVFLPMGILPFCSYAAWEAKHAWNHRS
jgi:hypothetical protein